MRIYIDLLSSPQVQRIVITSSVAAVMSLVPKPTVFSEKDWNLASIKEIQEKGNKSAPFTAYLASKTLAEKGGLLLKKYPLFSVSLLLVPCNQLPGIFMKSTSLKLNGI